MMHHYTRLTTLLLFALAGFSANAQTWISYTCYNHVNAITVQQDTVWICTDGGLEKRLSDGTLLAQLDRLDGLPDVKLYDLVIDNNGNKWLATNTGVARFDGVSWTVFNTSNSSIPYDDIMCLAVDPASNHIWAGTYYGVSEFDGTNWITYTITNSPLSNNHASAIAGDGNGNIWIATDDGVNIFDGINWSLYKKNNSGLPDNYVNSVCFDQNGNAWIGTSKGAAMFDGTNWTVYDENNSGLNNDDVYEITPVSATETWFGTFKGVSRLLNGTWNTFLPSNSNIPEKEVLWTAKDNTGQIWMSSTESGAVKYDGQNFVNYKDTTLLNNDITDVVFDHTGKMWVVCADYYGDTKGIVVYDGQHWEQMTYENSILPPESLYSIDVDSKNNIWTNSYEHLLKHDSLWHDYTYAQGDLSCSPNSYMYVAPSDTIWMCYGGGSCPYTHAVFYDSVLVKNYDWNNSINLCAQQSRPAADSQGNLWFCSCNSLGGVLKYTGDTAIYIPFDPQGYPMDHVAIDAFDNIWCAGYSGFWIYDQTNWTVNTAIPNFDFQSTYFRSLAFDENNNLWMSFHSNYTNKDFLYEYDGTTWTELTLDNSPLSTAAVNSIKLRDDGSIWFATSKGLMGYFPQGVATGNISAETQHPVTIFPNPAHDEIVLNVKSDDVKGSTLFIFNSMHQLVKSQALTTGKSVIRISNLPAGIYIAELRNEHFSVSKKLVIQ